MCVVATADGSAFLMYTADAWVAALPPSPVTSLHEPAIYCCRTSQESSQWDTYVEMPSIREPAGGLASFVKFICKQ